VPDFEAEEVQKSKGDGFSGLKKRLPVRQPGIIKNYRMKTILPR
jgi:hypothetical protein